MSIATPYDRFLDALGRHGSVMRDTPRGVLAQCPAHSDEHPSLSVDRGTDQYGFDTVLLQCRSAGCATEAICAALGLAPSDLFTPTPLDDYLAGHHSRVVETYSYIGLDGVERYQKQRLEGRDGRDKDFRLRRRGPDGRWIYRNVLAGIEKVLYRLPELVAGIAAGRRVFVVEGERDVNRLAALGEVATCNVEGASKPPAAPKWLPSYTESLRGAHVTVVADNDVAGYAHARHIAASLAGVAASVRLVRGAVQQDKADISDHLDAGHDLDELVDIGPEDSPSLLEDQGGDIDDGDDVEVSERIFAHEVAQELRRMKVRHEAQRLYRAEQAGPLDLPVPVSLTDLLSEPDEPTRYRIDGLLPSGGRVVLAAQYKAGKSTAIGNLIRCLADGEQLFGKYPVSLCMKRVVLLDNEMPRETMRIWLRDQGIRNTDKVTVIPIRGNMASFNVLDADVRMKWVEMIRHYDPEVLIVDCLRPILDALGLDENIDAGQVLVALDEITEQTGASELVVVHHMGHFAERSRGSSRIRDWPDAEWRLVRKDPDNPASQRFFTAYGRDVDVSETALEFNPETRHLTVAGGSRMDVSVHLLIPDLVDLLLDQPGLSGRSIEDMLMDVGISRSTVRAALQVAIDEGYVITVPGPKRSTLHHASPVKHPAKPFGQSSSAPVRRGSFGALNEGYPNLSAPKDQTDECAGQSSSAPVRRSAPDLSAHCGGVPCAGPVELSPVGGAPTGALNGQVSALEEDHTQNDLGALDKRSQKDRHQAPGAGDDQWVRAHLTRSPQTVEQLVTDLAVSGDVVRSALARLEANGYAQRHRVNGRDNWSLPISIRKIS